MIINFNPSRINVEKGKLFVGFDIRPDKLDEPDLYSMHYVLHADEPPPDDMTEEQSDEWWDKVGKHYELNPCLSNFVIIDEDTTENQLGDYLGGLFSPERVKSLDDALVLHDSAHRVGAILRTVPPITSKNIEPQDIEALKQAVSLRFADLVLNVVKGDIGIDYEPKSIDIGPGAISGQNAASSQYTVVDEANPANADGILDVIELYAYSSITGMRVATFFNVSGLIFSTRDTHTIGDVPSGSKQTYSGITDFNVVTGDYIGHKCASGAMCRSSGGCWYKSGDYIPCTDVTFSSYSKKYSIYGTGVESGGPTTGWNQLQYTSEPPTTNAWNQIKHTVVGGWNQVNYEGQ